MENIKTSEPSGMSRDDRYKNLERVNYWIANCDTKASFLLGFTGIILTLLFTSTPIGSLVFETIKNFKSSWFSEKSNYEIFALLEVFILFAFIVIYIIAVWHLLEVFRGRISPDVYKDKGLVTNSNLFFGIVASKNFQEFKDSQSNPNYNLDDDIDSQFFINSKICTIKFKHYNNAIEYLKFSILLFFIYFIFKSLI